MQDFGIKSDDTAGPSGQLSAAEFNNLATELENSVLRSGQALIGGSVTQLATSMFLHGVKSESFQDSGAANAYVATPVSGAGGVLLPADYTAMHGAVISFRASNANSGAPTLNVGQTTGTLLGSKAIVDQAGAALISGAISASTYIQLRYDSTIGAGSWVLLPWSRGGQLLNTRIFTASGTYTPTPGTRFIIIEGNGAGAAGGGIPILAAGQISGAGGGASGAYGLKKVTSAFAGVAVTIGAAGVGVAGGTGGTGGSTLFGTLLTLPGGNGAPAGSITTTTFVTGPSGTGSSVPLGADVGFSGTAGSFGTSYGGTSGVGGAGASSRFGSGGGGGIVNGASAVAAGNIAGGFGAGGGGAIGAGGTGAAQAGGDGVAGILIINEYA